MPTLLSKQADVPKRMDNANAQIIFVEIFQIRILSKEQQ
jgi:hypothetical protein